MNELWIVRFVRKDGKPDEEYYYRSLAEAEHLFSILTGTTRKERF